MLSKFRQASILAIAAMFIFSGHSNPAAASTITRDIIRTLEITSTGNLARVNVLTRAVEGRGTCHTHSDASGFVFDFSTAKGKALFSFLNAALLAGKKVEFRGINTCADYEGKKFEILNSAKIED